MNISSIIKKAKLCCKISAVCFILLILFLTFQATFSDPSSLTSESTFTLEYNHSPLNQNTLIITEYNPYVIKRILGLRNVVSFGSAFNLKKPEYFDYAFNFINKNYHPIYFFLENSTLHTFQEIITKNEDFYFSLVTSGPHYSLMQLEKANEKL